MLRWSWSVWSTRQPESHGLLKSSVYFKHFFELSLEVSLKVWALGSQGARPVTLPAGPSTPLLLLHLNTCCLVLTCMEPPRLLPRQHLPELKMVSFLTHSPDPQAFLSSCSVAVLHPVPLLGHCHFYPGSHSLEKTLLPSLTLSLQLQGPRETPASGTLENASTGWFSALLGGRFSTQA